MRTEPIADFITVSVSSMLNSSTAVSEVLLSVVIVNIVYCGLRLCFVFSSLDVVKKKKREGEGGEETSERLAFHQVLLSKLIKHKHSK